MKDKCWRLYLLEIFAHVQMPVEFEPSRRHLRRHCVLERLDDLIGAATDVDAMALDPSGVAPASIRNLADEIRADLLRGHGFTLLRGLPVADIDRRTRSREAAVDLADRINIYSEEAAAELRRLNAEQDLSQDEVLRG